MDNCDIKAGALDFSISKKLKFFQLVRYLYLLPVALLMGLFWVPFYLYYTSMTFWFGDHVIGCPDGRKIAGNHILEHFLDQKSLLVMKLDLSANIIFKQLFMGLYKTY